MSDTSFEQAFFGMIDRWPTVSLAALRNLIDKKLEDQAFDAALHEKAPVVFLCSAGLLVNLSLVNAVRIRITPGGPPWLMAICTLILGLGSYAPLLVARADMWEIPIAFSYLSISVALRCLWEAFGNPGRSAKWIAFASAAVGAAFAARPTALPNAAILLIPFFSRETRRSAWAWVA